MKAWLRRLFFGLRMDCGWCNRRMQRRGLFCRSDAVSHGLCAQCVPMMRRSVRSSGLEVPGV
jgi:hypothetical protein